METCSFQTGFQNLKKVHKLSDSPYQNQLNGFCSDCPFSKNCWSGCGWSATTTMGKKGDNPYCMFRAIVNLGRGKYEQLIQKHEA